MISGAREGRLSGLRRFFAKAMAKDLNVLVIPGLDIARVNGLDIAEARLHVVASPRHANVLLIIGDQPPAIFESASVVYAQMLRPKVLLCLSSKDLGLKDSAIAPLPAADVCVGLSQEDLVKGVEQVRTLFETSAFQLEVEEFKPSILTAQIEYVCPMHPEVVRPEPGTCPKCGMFLVEREAEVSLLRKLSRHDETEVSSDPDGHEAKHANHAYNEQMTTEYFCPMHLEVVQDEAGDCPKCGMHLEPRKVENSVHSEDHESNTEYFCPMHPEVVQDEAGDCPKCGMHLEPREVENSVQSEDHESNIEYFCPMHPEVVRDEAGDCPKCGMHLEPREKQPAHEHEESGFMSMIDVTKDLPLSGDDLAMEWIDVAFGPFFPGLPSGLLLEFTLDGDTIEGSQAGSITQNIEVLKNVPMHGGCFVTHFLNLDPLTPIFTKVLLCEALENLAGIDVDEATKKSRIAAQERERVASHLNWLALFAQQTGFAWLEKQASSLELKVMNASVNQLSELNSTIQILIARIRKTPLMKARLLGIGKLAQNEVLCGIVARAADINIDVRLNNETYSALGFKSLTRTGGDAWSRLQLRLDEIMQSLALIKSAGEISLPELIDINSLTGSGEAEIESPRGKLHLQLTIEDGFVGAVKMLTPSQSHLDLIEQMTDRQELGDALVAVGSLDLSPWEIRQ